MLYEITNALAHPNHTVTITWSDGSKAVVNFEPYIAKGGLFTALNDSDYFVREMSVLPNGIGLAWPNEVDFSADGLRYDAFPKDKTGEFGEVSGVPGSPAKTDKPSLNPPR